MSVNNTICVMSTKSSFSFSFTPSSTARKLFYYVQSAGHFYCNKEYITKRKGYDSFLFMYTLKGKGYVCFRNNMYELSSKKAVLINCNDYQEYYTDKTDLWEFKWIHFNGCNSEAIFNMIYDNFGPVIDFKDNYASIETYISEIESLINKHDAQFEIKTNCILTQLLTCLLISSTFESSCIYEKNKNSLNYHNIKSVIEYIHENYQKEISVEDMARFAYCSKYHFCRTFKKITGFSPYEYLINCRINKAKNMLISTSYTIEDISFLTGFNNASNFINKFKQLEGMTPSRYRKYYTNHTIN